MTDFAHIQRPIDLTEIDIENAIDSGEATRKLLLRLSEVSGPNLGVAKVLLVFARMATSACDWVDGDLRVEIVGDDEVSAIEVLTELGGGMCERVWPTLPMRAPLIEFTRAIERMPHLVEPLTVQSKKQRRVVLAATREVRESPGPPRGVRIAEESILVDVPLAPSKPPSGSLPIARAIGPMKKRSLRPIPGRIPGVQHTPVPPERTSTRPSTRPALNDLEKGWDDDEDS